MKNIKSAFTLVELIVVITIVSILSTIGFVAYVDYLKGVRDSNRLQQMSEIHGAMELYATRRVLPFPDDDISIVAGSTQVGYQGVAGNSVLDAIRFGNGGKDPGSKKYFTYYLSADRKYAQLLAYFEEQQVGNLLSSHRVTAQYDTLYPQVYGAELGVLVQEGTNIPVQELSQYTASGKLDILSITAPVVSYLTNTEQITGVGQDLIGMIPNTSCKKLRDIYGYTTSGIYKINPSGTKMLDVYCDMVTEGGGWTMIARSVENYIGDMSFGWLIERGNVFDMTEPYSLGSDIKNIQFDNILYTKHLNDISINGGWLFTEFDNTLVINEESALVAVPCTNIDGGPGPNYPYSCHNYLGNITNTGGYIFGFSTSSANGILNSTRFFTTRGGGNPLNRTQGMIFIR